MVNGAFGGAQVLRRGREVSNLTHVRRAIELLQARFAEPLPGADLARAARMSAATFHRHFRKVTAMSPMQFQEQLQLQEARARVLAQASDVSSVSFAVGYQSPSQFSREYRRQFGLPPGEDRGAVAKPRPRIVLIQQGAEALFDKLLAPWPTAV